MDKVIRILALIANGLGILGILLLWQENRPHGSEILIFLGLFLPPVLSLLALRSGVDAETRRLQRRLLKAELRHKLKALGEEV